MVKESSWWLVKLPNGLPSRLMPRKRTINNSRRVTVTFEGNDYDQLIEISREHGLSVAWVVRRAVSEFVSRRAEDGANTLILTGHPEK